MNKLINNLIREATTTTFNDDGAGFHRFDKEKFATLIIDECIQIFPNNSYSMNECSGKACREMIRNHFNEAS